MGIVLVLVSRCIRRRLRCVGSCAVCIWVGWG